MAEMARPRQFPARLQRMQVAVAVAMPEALAQRAALAAVVAAGRILRRTSTASTVMQIPAAAVAAAELTLSFRIPLMQQAAQAAPVSSF